MIVEVAKERLTNTRDSKYEFGLVTHTQTRSPSLATDQPNPVAIIAADRAVAATGEKVTFNGNASWTYAWDGASWSAQTAAANATAMPRLVWNWGDGSSNRGSPVLYGTPSHTYSTTGLHTVELVASNYLGVVDVAECTVLVTGRPPPSSLVKHRNV